MRRLRTAARWLNRVFGTGLLFDLWMHARRTVCVLARGHVGRLVAIGIMQKHGFRGGPVVQCTFCHEIKFSSERDAMAFGGKR